MDVEVLSPKILSRYLLRNGNDYRYMEKQVEVKGRCINNPQPQPFPNWQLLGYRERQLKVKGLCNNFLNLNLLRTGSDYRYKEKQVEVKVLCFNAEKFNKGQILLILDSI